MTKLRLGLLTILVTGTTFFGLTQAFFSDTEKASGNSFIAGKLDLKVNGEDNPTAIVSFDDLKPGDVKIFHKDLFVDFNPARIFLHLKDLSASQGAQTEPEDLEENGTPKFDIQNYINYDLTLNIGSESAVLISDADGISLPDAVSCWIPVGIIPGATHVTLDQSFHFDPTVTNWAQGDTLEFAEEFLALQVNDPQTPLTGSGRVWDPQLKKCIPQVTPTPTTPITPTVTPTPIIPTPTPLACVETYASSFEQVSQGTQKSGAAVLASRSNGNFALGAPQSSGLPVDGAVPANSFFSLGFKLQTQGAGGSIVLKFTSPFYNQPGNDIQAYEVTGATNPPYPDEKIKIDVSSDGAIWTTVAASVARDAAVDMSPVPSAQFVRITDVSDIALFPTDADAYDLDAVKAFCGSNPIN